MTTWREDLRRVTVAGRRLIGASFRGAPFFVEGADRSGGRRAVVHEFPLRDAPFVEDLGRKAASFRIDGYVIGDDYIEQRDALLVALEGKAGPGALVHPYYGSITAICVSVSVRESRADGGMATFAIEFAHAPAQSPTPTEVVDAAAHVALAADAADIEMDAEFVGRYDTAGMPAFSLGSAQAALTKAAAGMKSALSPVVSATQELAEFTGRVATLTATATTLVRTPAAVLGAFRYALDALVDTVAASPGAVMDALLDAYAVDLGTVVVATTATRARELENQIALTSALRRVMAIEAARLAPLVPYTSIDEAADARDRVAAVLEEQANTATDPAYPAIVNLRSEVLSAVPGGAAFARVVIATRNVPIPSLLLAYQLYGSVDLEADIVARNAVPHPGFVVGDLRVLSDV